MPDAVAEPRSRGKIGVLIEEHFDATEFRAFNDYFPRQGFAVEYLSRLWGEPSLTFHSNVDDAVMSAQVTVTTEVESVCPADFAGVIAIGGYAMDRLRYREDLRRPLAPAVTFLRVAMETPGLTLGAVCHGLWLWCALPNSLVGRRVTCAHNIVSDVEHAGAVVVSTAGQAADVVVDGNLVTGRHPATVLPFMTEFLRGIDLNHAPHTATIVA